MDNDIVYSEGSNVSVEHEQPKARAEGSVSGTAVTVQAKRVVISAKVTRADGTVEDYGVVSDNRKPTLMTKVKRAMKTATRKAKKFFRNLLKLKFK